MNKRDDRDPQRSARSVFVGNISYECTEAQLRQTFAQVGTVTHIRMVTDHDSGRPKGYGFIEFADVQTADAAIRNMNGFELNGRALRVDSATGGDRSTEEVQQFEREPVEPPVPESPYGPEPELGKAPEAIARTVASMPPERMFELMRQMKDTVLNNPMMARHLLMENPQLAYALLQAQVVMRVVDPKVAYSMLHREQSATQQPFHQQGQQVQGPPTMQVAPQAQHPQGNQHAFYNAPPPMSGPLGQFPLTQQPPPSFGFPGQQYRPMNQMNIPPPGLMGAQPSPSQPPAQAQKTAEQLAAEEEVQAQMLVKVLQLTDQQIQLLPEDRAKVMELRTQLRQQVPS